MQTNQTWNNPNLTKQQNAICYDYCEECLSDKEVADKRCISINTVQTHKKKIFEVLTINKITQLSKLFFTATYMIAVLFVGGLGRSSLRLNISMQPNRTYVSRIYRRSRRRIDNVYVLETTYYIPISA